ncbi:MAG TPA: SDR family NAD(P)-dependent oxidoreductase [Gemmatimonadaceae bacterium]|nr:SDR family NAD(P)-dependent oxidoreductase [Gemmatimonadaceae bacterium]
MVTGASRNIGRQIALSLAAEGCAIVVHTGSNVENATAVVSEIEAGGGSAFAVVADLGDPAQVSAMISRAHDRLGPIDILVNNVGFRPQKKFVDITNADWDRVMAVNLDGAFYCCSLSVQDMIAKKQGCIINIVGIAIFNGGTQYSHVVAAKAGLHGLTKALAVELGEYGIRVNSVVLGSIDTVRETPVVGGLPPLATIPLQRRGSVLDVGSVCAFLVSDGASYITGQAIHVNGGLLLA